MRAVNLIPAEQRRGGATGAGRTGGAVYIVLGALGVLLIAMTAYVLTSNSVNNERAKLAKVESEAQQARAQAAALGPYRQFAQLRETRVATVSGLAASRFDWGRALRKLAAVLPRDVWLTEMTGTVAPGVSFDGSGSGGGTSGLRGALTLPAVELSGCTTSHSEVSRIMARLRLIEDVERVSLAASEKTQSSTSTAGGATTSGGGGDCRHGNARFPQFSMVVFFRGPSIPGSTPVAPAVGGQAATASATAQGSQSQSGSSQPQGQSGQSQPSGQATTAAQSGTSGGTP